MRHSKIAHIILNVFAVAHTICESFCPYFTFVNVESKQWYFFDDVINKTLLKHIK